MAQTIIQMDLSDLQDLISRFQIKNEIWTTQQAADYLKSSCATVNKEAELGIIPGVKVGKNWKFSSIALFKYVAKE